MSSATRTMSFERAEVCGVPVLLAPTPGTGIIAANLMIRRGSADETPAEHGLASFTGSMLRRGTKSRSSRDIAFELESLGAMTSHGAGLDTAASTLRCAAADFDPSFEILMDCVRDPAFDSSEMEIERESVIAHIRRLEDDKFDYTYHEYTQRMFEGHAYGHPIEGEEADVARIDSDACRRWHRRAYQPANMLFTATGDFEPGRMLATLERSLSDWPASDKSPPRNETPTPQFDKPRLDELEKGDLEQGFVILGFHAPPVPHPDFPALRLACAVLGEGFTGRLFTHLRDERSLAYAVGSMIRSHRLGGHTVLYIGTKPESIDEAHEGLAAEAARIAKEGISAEDLDRACKYVSGKYLMDHESHGSRAGYLARWEDLGVGAEYDGRFIDDLRAVTADQVRDAAARWWVNPTTMILRPGEEGSDEDE